MTYYRDEWGNPNNETIYKVMMDYAPYENVRPQSYPAMMILSGLQDSRVKYQEPTKWVAKMRKAKRNELQNADGACTELLLKANGDDTSLLFYVNNYGHFGASGDEYYHDTARWITFVLANFNLIN
jgi:oligopeptidase B